MTHDEMLDRINHLSLERANAESRIKKFQARIGVINAERTKLLESYRQLREEEVLNGSPE